MAVMKLFQKKIHSKHFPKIGLVMQPHRDPTSTLSIAF